MWSPKSPLVKQIVNELRRRRVNYEGFRQLFRAVRTQLDLKPAPRSRQLPRILPEQSLKKLYEAIDRGDNLQHSLMLRLLFYSGARIRELTNIRVDEVDLDACTIRIEQGKGHKDRYILFPENFRLALRSHLQANPQNRYLFESRRKTKFSVRRVEYIMKDYVQEAGLRDVHPHLLRHQLLTWLTAQGLPDAKIQLISGHASRKSLEVYQHLALKDVAEEYQEAVRKLPV